MSKCKYCGIDGGTHACNPKDITVNMQKQDIAILRQGIAEQSKRVRELEDCLQATRAYINELEILVDERTATIEQLQLDNARMREALEDKSTLITSQGIRLMQQEDDLSCIDKALRMAMDAINNLSSCIDDKYMELTRGEDWHDRYVIKPIEALKEALQPDRTGLTYYKNDACKAQNANSPDCICWTPKQPIDQAATS